MQKLIIDGEQTLKGEVKISGSKNAALPIMAATLLTDEPCVIRNVPNLRDTRTMVELLKSLGKKIEVEGSKVTIWTNGKLNHIAD